MSFRLLQRETGGERSVGMADRGDVRRLTAGVSGFEAVVEAGEIGSSFASPLGGAHVDPAFDLAIEVLVCDLWRVVSDPRDSRHCLVLPVGILELCLRFLLQIR